MNPCLPVIINSAGTDPQVSRCIYFHIELDETLDPWRLSLGSVRFPFFMLGLSGILYEPADGTQRFNKSSQIAELIRLIEEVEGRSVETSYLWLPSKLIAQNEGHRNDVFRIGIKLFALATQFRGGGIDIVKFLHDTIALDNEVSKSPEETAAFGIWAEEEIQSGRRWRNEDEPPPIAGEDEDPEPPPPGPPQKPTMPFLPEEPRRRRMEL